MDVNSDSCGARAPAHLPSPELIGRWPQFTPANPLKVLISGCLAGLKVGVDGTTNGDHPHIRALISRPDVSAIPFCPEAFSFGVPRPTPDIAGGDGRDVLDGRARVFADTGEDFTQGMIAGAEAMLATARANAVHLALLMDISAACGSQVIYLGPRSERRYQIGYGVAAALLAREGITITSQRDYKTLDRILAHLDPSHTPLPEAKDHHEIDWYRDYFRQSVHD